MVAMAAKHRKSKVAAEWRKLFRLLPGYDPELTAWPKDEFDPVSAQHAIDFIEQCCRHVEGKFADEPFILQPWQRAVIGCLFGWMREDGSRRYRKLFLYVPRGNGKTPLLAAIALLLLYGDGEKGAQIYLIASRAEQAALAYKHCRGMVEREPMFANVSQIFKGQSMKAITLRSDPAAFIRVFPSDAEGIHGQIPHAVIGDEIHAWQGTEAMEAIKTSFAKKGRRQPLEIYATTADFDRPSACNDEYDAACAVRDNPGDGAKPGYDREVLPVIFEAKQTDDWTSEEVWEKANPNIDVTVSRESLRVECQRAIEQPTRQAEFKRLHLNIRTTTNNIYIPLERWDKCTGNVPMESLAGRPCFAGLDVSTKQDITALSLVFPPDSSNEPYAIVSYFWIPEANMREKEKVDRVPYSVWVEQGLVFATPGNMIDEDSIESHIMNYVRNNFQIVEIGFDPWNAMGLGERLNRNGVKATEFPQTITRLTAGTKALDDLVVQKRIAHFGNPVLRWMLSCTDVVGDKNQNIRPVKPERKTGKRIDGVVATIMGLGLALLSNQVNIQCPLVSSAG